MIKVRVTKNIIRKNEVAFGFTRSQFIVAAIGLLIGILEFYLLKDAVSTDLRMTLIFITMGIVILGGVIQVNGQPVIPMFLKMIKGVEKRPYDRKGVYNAKNEEK